MTSRRTLVACSMQPSEHICRNVKATGLGGTDQREVKQHRD